ncbi:ATP-binding protein [Azospirillum sp.]|uniref:ATP-binding protein n=1 Tax=Azospirillum sp. TaxID=34012 RepID=UPI002D5BA0DA|nr:winged helix-turn-helix domain-containing protein [Azospirillum sp.]HYF88034.1 winged helix-turn-helix domain-containing protein [Azospirillum sp.]
MSLGNFTSGSGAADLGAGPQGGGPAAPFSEFGPFRLFPTERRLTKQGETVPLGGRALDILLLLVRNAGKVVTKQELIAQVWKGVSIDESGLRAQVASLRRVLGDGVNGVRYIINVAGQGYCFVHPLTEPGTPHPSSPIDPIRRRGTPLPRRSTSMVDREEDTRAISELLARHRFVTIHGAGGIGKTTVALAVANQLLEGFQDQVCFLDLGLLRPSDPVPDEMATALGVAVRSGDPTSSIVAYLRDRRILLVLDCCEHVIDSVAPLAEAIMQEAPHVSMLATSREPLLAGGEHVYALAPLNIPPDGMVISADDMLRYTAASLFIERAYAAGLRRPLNDLDAQVIADICRKVDGIALALELAAGRVSVHGLEGTASLLDGRLKLLWQGRRTAVARHRTLNATLDWSHDLTSPEEQAVLRRLSVLVGPFTVNEARTIASSDDLDGIEVIDALARLVSKSLVNVDPDVEPARYRLLDTTRAYARGKLTESGEEAMVARRHATYFTTWLAHELTKVGGQGGEAGVPSAIHLGNIRSALDWSSSKSDMAEIHVQLAALAAELFLDLNLFTECRRTCERALCVLDASLSGTRHEMVLHGSLGRALLLTDNSGGDTEAHFQRALEIAETLNEGVYRFRTLNDLHIHYRRAAVFDRLVPMAEQAVSIAASLSDSMITATANLMLGASHHLVGNLAVAQTTLSGSIRHQIFPGQASHKLMDFQSKAQLIMAQTLWLQGYPDQAADTVREAERFEPTNDLSICQSLILAMELFRLRRDWALFEERLDRLIRLSSAASLAPYEWLGMAFKGEVALRRGNVGPGMSVIRDYIAKLQADRFELFLPCLRCTLAEGLATRGYWDQALDLVRVEIDSVLGRGGAYYLPELLRVYGDLLTMAGDETEAEAQYLRSITVAKEQAALSWQLRTTISFSRLALRQGRRREAHTKLEEVLSAFTEGFKTEDLQQARLLLDRLAVIKERR